MVNVFDTINVETIDVVQKKILLYKNHLFTFECFFVHTIVIHCIKILTSFFIPGVCV